MKRILINILIVAFAVSEALSQTDIEADFTARISKKNLQQTVRELVKCGNRLGGTPSAERAVNTITSNFKQYGYDPIIIEEPERLVYTHIKWTLQVDSPKTLRGLIQHEWLAGFSPSIATTRLPLVYYTPQNSKKNLSDKVVLLSYQPNEEEYNEFAAVGARALLTYEIVRSQAYLHGAMITTLKPSADNPIPVYNISRTAGERLRKELEKGTEIIVRFSATTNTFYGKSKTVMVTIPGKKSDYFIVCAHGDADSGGPGADDNASGVAAVLELSRIMKLMINKKILSEPEYSIKFIIWGTEYESAKHYIREVEKDLGKIKAVINIDQVGTGRPRQCIYFEGNDITYNEALLRVFERVGEEYAGKRGFWKEATTNPSQDGTDSYVFMPRFLRSLRVQQVKIPTITVFTAAWNEPKVIAQTPGWSSKAWKGHTDSVVINFSPYYHSSLDIPRLTTDKEPEKMFWAVSSVGLSLLRVLWKN